MPKYTLETTPEFDRRLMKMLSKNVSLKKSVQKTFELILEDPFYSSLKTHKVETKRYGIRYSSWVTGDFRFIWDFSQEGTVILLLTVGGHEGKWKVCK